jgi:hypothetical protein
MLDNVEYAQERYREQVAQGLVLARLERAREAEQRATDASHAGQVRRAIAKVLVTLANALSPSAQREMRTE